MGDIPQRWWTPATHHEFHVQFRKRVLAFLLCTRAPETEETLGKLPHELLLLVVELMAKPIFQELISVGSSERPRPSSWHLEAANLTWPLRILWPAQTLHDRVRISQGRPPLQIAAGTLFFQPHDQ